MLFAGACLLLPAAVLAQQSAALPPDALPSAPPATSGEAAASPGTVGSNTTLTIGGKLDLHLVGKPTLTTPDGVVYKLVGEQASTIEQLKQIDDKTIVVAGQVVKDGDSPTLNLSILSFWVVGSSSAIGSVPAAVKGEGATVTPILTARGTLGTKLVGKPDLTTFDGKIYTLIGPQVATIEQLKGLDMGQLEVNGQLINNDGRLDIVVLSFRLLNTAGGPNGTGTIGTPTAGGATAATEMEPSVTVEGVITTSMASQPDLQAKDGKMYRLIGPEVSLIGVTKGIDGKNVTVTGQLMTNGKFENLVVSSFQVQEPQPAPVAEQPAPVVTPAAAPPVAAPADPQDAPSATPKL